jgi:Mrp family chromosome partitioning ATPase
MFRRKKRNDSKESETTTTPLLLFTQDGISFVKIPPELVNSIRYLVTRLIYKESLPSKISFVSSLRQEGVTYISRAFAAILANDFDVSVCLVELNWEWPDQTFRESEAKGGLADVLQQQATVQDVIIKTTYPNLDIIASGKLPLSDRPRWARSVQISEVINDLSNQYDHLIFDIPAILATNDSIPLASLADTCCLVINQGVTPLESTRQALGAISHLPVAGVVMNNVKVHTPSWIYKYIPQDVVLSKNNQNS